VILLGARSVKGNFLSVFGIWFAQAFRE